MKKDLKAFLIAFAIVFSLIFIVDVSAFDWDNNNVQYYFNMTDKDANYIFDRVNSTNCSNVNSPINASGIIGDAINFTNSQRASNMTPAGITWPEGSFSFWIYKNVDGASWTFGNDDGGNNDHDFYFFPNPTPQVIWADGASQTVVSSNKSMPPGEWHHVVILWGTGGLQLWQNNTLTGSSAVTDGPDLNIWLMGAASGSDAGYGNAAFDEFGVWDKRLTVSEISELWNNGTGLQFGGTIPEIQVVELISPVNNTNKINNETIFSANVTAATYNMTNATLFVWHSNGTLFNSFVNNLTLKDETNTEYNFNVTIIEDDYEWNVRLCEGDGASGNCSFSVDNNTLNIKNYTTDGQNYSVSAIEQTQHPFYFNFSVSSIFSVNIATMTYNNTNFTGAISNLGGGNYQASTNVIAPSVSSDTNVTFNWTIQLSDGVIIKSDDEIQTVFNLGIDNCSTNTIQILNFTVVDEQTQSLLNATGDNTSIKVEVGLFKSISSTSTVASFSSLYNQTNPARVCISEELGTSEFFMDVLVEYDAFHYAKEFYNIKKYSLNASSGTNQNITLYDLPDDFSQEFVISYKDESFLAVSDALIQIRRKYVDDGVTRTVELPKTGADGQVVGHLVIDDVIYSFIIVKDGEIIATFDNKRAICQNPTLETCKIELNSFSSDVTLNDFQTEGDFQYTLTYAPSTRTISSTFVVPSGAVSTVFLNVTMADALGTSVCNEQVTTSSGTLNCVVADTFGNATAIATIYKDGAFISQGTINLSQSPTDIYGVSLAFLGIVLILTIVGAGLSDDPIFTIIFLMLGVVLLFVMNLVDHNGFIGRSATILWLFIALILVLIKTARRQN